mgnify:CR=1 FL=1
MWGPKTSAETRDYNYGHHWRPTPYDPAKCAEAVHEGGRGGGIFQCKRKPGHGPDGLRCKRSERWDREWRAKDADRIMMGLRDASTGQLRAELKRRGEEEEG